MKPENKKQTEKNIKYKNYSALPVEIQLLKTIT